MRPAPTTRLPPTRPCGNPGAPTASHGGGLLRRSLGRRPPPRVRSGRGGGSGASGDRPRRDPLGLTSGIRRQSMRPRREPVQPLAVQPVPHARAVPVAQGC